VLEAGAGWHPGLLGLCASPKEDSGISSAQLVLGTPLLLPGKLLNMPEPSLTFMEADLVKMSYAEVWPLYQPIWPRPSKCTLCLKRRTCTSPHASVWGVGSVQAEHQDYPQSRQQGQGSVSEPSEGPHGNYSTSPLSPASPTVRGWYSSYPQAQPTSSRP
jgi:hypothetical protein